MESSEVDPTYSSPTEAERPIVDAIEALVERLRDPSEDPVTRVQAAAPMVDALTNQWTNADIPNPSAKLMGHARALKVELDSMRSKLAIRGRALARIRRAVDDAQGSTYDKGAARRSGDAGRVRDLTL